MSIDDVLIFIQVFGPLTTKQLAPTIRRTMEGARRACVALEKSGDVVGMQEYNSRRMIWWAK